MLALKTNEMMMSCEKKINQLDSCSLCHDKFVWNTKLLGKLLQIEKDTPARHTLVDQNKLFSYLCKLNGNIPFHMAG